MSKTNYQVLARRYRPKVFGDVVGQDSIVTTLKNALRFDKIAHAYLFCGSRGVGKTTLARLFAKALNCERRTAEFEPCNECSSCLEISSGQSLDVIEIDGASNRGIDDIRQINETIIYAPSQGRFKIYIIDEVHMLTKEAFNALLKTLEEPPEKVKFFFATTEPHKVLPTIISRCQRFDLSRIASSQIVAKLEEIASDLKRTAEPDALSLIASFSDGSLRDAESLFDQILCFADQTVNTEVVREALGLVSQDYFFLLDQAFSKCDIGYSFDLAASLFAAGKDLAHFYEQLIEHIRLLTLAKTMGEKGIRITGEMGSEIGSKYLESARLYTTAQCLYLLDYLLKTEQQIQKSTCQRISLEVALLHYIQSKNRVPVEMLVRKLIELEQKIHQSGTLEPQTKVVEEPPPLPKLIEVAVKLPAPEKSKILTPVDRVAIDDPSLTSEPIPGGLARKRGEDMPQKGNFAAANSFAIASEEITQPAVKLELPKVVSPAPAASYHHPSHYDTLIRFAAVELEGTVKK